MENEEEGDRVSDMKAILFDADGVVIKKHGYFSERYAREHGVPLEIVRPFFINEFPACQRGKADLKEILAPHLPEWKWDRGAEAFLTTWFESDTDVDTAVMAEVAKLRAAGTRCYLATDQEKYRAEYLRTRLRFAEQFDDCFFSCEIGHTKSEPEFFRYALEKSGLPASDVSYWDDDEENVAVAKALGIDARFWSGEGVI